MQLRTYVFQLLGLCIFLVIILLGLCKGFSNAFGQYFDFSLIVIAIFAFINLQIYYFGTITIRNKNKYLFTNITMGMTFVKILLSIAIIVVYKSKYYPPDTNYIVPFFLIYALFTIFETYKLSKLVQTRSNS
jgi:hypothetical protein